MPNSKTWVWLAVIALLTVQAVQMVIMLHRESLTWDEEAHMYAGYRMWKNADFGAESGASAAGQAAGHAAGAGQQALGSTA